eukprot:m51a1_g13779 putative transforming growth factor beta-1-induced transcript 1 protein (499) ;mRNA; r:291038-292831
MTVYKSKPLKGSRGDGVMSIPCDNTIISNETRIQFFHKTSKCKMFAFTIHTAFVGENLCLWKHDLDAACKDTSHKTFSPNFYIQLFFKEFSNDDEEDAVRCCTCGKIINKGDLSVHCGQNAWHWSCTFCSSCKQHVGDKCTFDSSDQPLCVRCAVSKDKDRGETHFFNFCEACGEIVEGDCIEAGDGVWHRYCFKCDVCHKHLLSGDTYTVEGKRPICYECSRAPSPELHRSCSELPVPLLPPKPENDAPRPRCSSWTRRLPSPTTKQSDLALGRPREQAPLPPLEPPPPPTPPASPRQELPRLELCAVCQRAMLPQVGVVVALGRKMHRACLACAHCGKALEDLRFREVEGQTWCATCYAEEVLPRCATCSLPIEDASYKVAGGMCFHSDCFKCAECGMPIASEFMRHEGRVYCVPDYSELFVKRCVACTRPLSSGVYIRLAEHSFHVECVTCRVCARSLKLDMFYLDPLDGWPTCCPCARASFLQQYPGEQPIRIT